MDIVGTLALIACASSICAKMLFSFRIRSLERIHEQENQSYQVAQNDLHGARQKHKQAAAEQKQHEAKRGATQRSIEKIKKSLQELQERKKEDDQVRAVQREMLQKQKPG